MQTKEEVILQRQKDEEDINNALNSLHSTDGMITRDKTRQEGESFIEYRVRLDMLKKATKQKLKGTIFHTSKLFNLPNFKGKTYYKPTNK